MHHRVLPKRLACGCCPRGKGGHVVILAESPPVELKGHRHADAGKVLQLTGALWGAISAPEDLSPRMLALELDG